GTGTASTLPASADTGAGLPNQSPPDTPPPSGPQRGRPGGGTIDPLLLTTSTTVTPGANTAVVGQALTFTVTVTSTNPRKPPPGPVTFKAGDANLGSVTLDTGGKAGISQAVFTVSTLTAGAHAIKAQYGGDTLFGQGDVITTNVTVNKDTTTTSLNS